MKKSIAFLIVSLFFFSGNVFASSFQYVKTIELTVGDIGGACSYADTVFFIQEGWPDNVLVTDLNGIITNIFPTSGAFTAGITYNPIKDRILFSGENDYTGYIYEMNPVNGVISGPVAQAGFVQPYLAYDGSSILASSAATGSNGILTIPINRFDALTYNNLTPISVTVNTGTGASGVSRSVITSDNGYLYVALGIGGLQDVYEFDGDLNFVQTIKITQIGSGQGIKDLFFTRNGLFVLVTGNKIYHYSRIPSTDIPTGEGGGGGGGGCSIISGRVSADYSGVVGVFLLFIPAIVLRIRRR